MATRKKLKGRWSLSAYIEHNELMREVTDKLTEANDRRYHEVKAEVEKALVIKDTANRDALKLSRDRQQERNVQSDALRDITLQNSGIYATNASVSAAIEKLEDSINNAIQPLVNFVSNQRGGERKQDKLREYVGLGVAAFGAYWLATH